MEKYRNPALSPEERAEDLLKCMTVEEKIGQTIMEIVVAFPDEKTAFERIASGSIGSCILSKTAFPGNSTASGIDIAFLNRCQKAAVENSRLGIPLIFGRDIIHGHYTVAPIPLAQAASFDRATVRRSAEVAAAESSAEGIHWTFAPMMDICRDPRWGRVVETFGEDPYLASEMAVAAVEGFQGGRSGRPDRKHMTACAKHFAGYGYAEGGRDYDSAEISRFTMLNTVLAPFRAAVRKAHCGSVMTSFQVTGGTPSSGDRFLLDDTLRKSWGFSGAVVSDFGSIDEVDLHGAAQDQQDAARKCLDAGVDIEMCNNYYPKYLPGLLKSGKLSMAALDRAAKAVLLMKFRAGLFEDPYTEIRAPESYILTPENRAAVRTAAADCMVLAKNDHSLLPLGDCTGKKIALVGPMVHERGALLGAWSGSGRAADAGTLAEAFAAAPHGAQILTTDSALTDRQIQMASKADIVIACVGESSSTTGEAHSSCRFALPPGQEEFLRELRKNTDRPILVLNVCGRPLPSPAAEEDADALLYTWHGGTETASAAVSVIFGEAEPGGRFPITVPRSVGQIPLYYGRKNPAKLQKEFLINMGYRFYDDGFLTPYHCFGSGMGYTTFDVSGVHAEKNEIARGESNFVSAVVRNTGSRRGKCVLQCYLHDPRCDYARPAKELCGFESRILEVGESAEIRFEISPEAMGYYAEDGSFVQESGEIRFGVGLSSDAGLTGSFQVK